MTLRLKNIVLLLLWLLPSSFFSQQPNRKSLEAERKSILQEINSTKKALDKTIKNKRNATQSYEIIENQVEKRAKILNNLAEDLELTDKDIHVANKNIGQMNGNLEQLKAEYGKMLRQSYRQQRSHNSLLFLFSADNFNQAFRRLQYMRRYDQFRKEQVTQIVHTKQLLDEKKVGLESEKKKKERLKIEAQEQKKALDEDLVEKERLIASLEKSQEKLDIQLKEQKKEHEVLNSAIEKAIFAENEARKARERQRQAALAIARTKTKPKTNNTSSAKPNVTFEEEKIVATPEIDAVSADFKQNKGRLPWPVANGRIIRGYGAQKHESLSKVMINNRGIDIETNPNAQVRAIFEGEVISANFVLGHNYMVIIKHGGFYTVYTKLYDVFVSKGQKVDAKQAIGSVTTNPLTNRAEMHLEIWENNNRINPAPWLGK